MTQTALLEEYLEFRHYAFVVKNKNDDNYLILGDPGLLKAVRAAGCLLEPRPGDLVLAAVSADAAFITTVLTQGAENEALLKLPARTTISAAGELKFDSDHLRASSAKASLQAADLTVDAIKGRARFEKFTLTGRDLVAKLARLKSMAGSIESTADRMVQRLSKSYRRISDFEDNRIGRWSCRIQELFSLRARDSHLISEKKTKIDAEKISLG